MSSTSSDEDERCYSEAYEFYGLLVHSESLVRPIEAFYTLHRQLAVLKILTTRRRRSGSQVFDSRSAASRIPEEIWHEIESLLISQELDLLEEIERVGNTESCGAGARLRKKFSEEWECVKRKDLPGYTAALCVKCHGHTVNGFEMRENALIILEELLATYSLYNADVKDPWNKFLGIAVHPLSKEASFQWLRPYSTACAVIPCPRPRFRKKDAHKRMAAFLSDFRVKYKRDPAYSAEREWGVDTQPESLSDDDEEEEDGGEPEWMRVHTIDNSVG